MATEISVIYPSMTELRSETRFFFLFIVTFIDLIGTG